MKIPTKSNSCYLDANFLVYLVQEDDPKHAKTKELLISLISTKVSLYISPLCLDEYIHTLRRSYQARNKKQIPKNYLTTLIKQVLLLPNLRIINPPVDSKSQLKIVNFLDNFKLRPRDAYHLLTIKHHKIKSIATFDKDFETVFRKSSLKHFTL